MLTAFSHWLGYLAALLGHDGCGSSHRNWCLYVPAKGFLAKSSAKLYNYNRKAWCCVYILGSFQILALSLAYLRFPTNDYRPIERMTKSMSAGVWKVHFSPDNDMWSSGHRMRDVIKELELDVVGLVVIQVRLLSNYRPTFRHFKLAISPVSIVSEPENSNTRIPEEQIPQGQRFPALFSREDLRGHKYRVFDDSRYFA